MAARPDRDILACGGKPADHDPGGSRHREARGIEVGEMKRRACDERTESPSQALRWQSLELERQTKLNSPGQIALAAHVPETTCICARVEGPAAPAGVRIAEVNAVEKVSCLSFESQSESLRQPRILEDVEILIEVAEPAYVRVGPSRGAELQWTRVCPACV